jgi:hypothetical protein
VFDTGTPRFYAIQYDLPCYRLCHVLLSTGAGARVGNQRDSSQPTPVKRVGFVSMRFSPSLKVQGGQFPNLEIRIHQGDENDDCN